MSLASQPAEFEYVFRFFVLQNLICNQQINEYIWRNVYTYSFWDHAGTHNVSSLHYATISLYTTWTHKMSVSKKYVSRNSKPSPENIPLITGALNEFHVSSKQHTKQMEHDQQQHRQITASHTCVFSFYLRGHTELGHLLTHCFFLHLAVRFTVVVAPPRSRAD